MLPSLSPNSSLTCPPAPAWNCRGTTSAQTLGASAPGQPKQKGPTRQPPRSGAYTRAIPITRTPAAATYRQTGSNGGTRACFQKVEVVLGGDGARGQAWDGAAADAQRRARRARADADAPQKNGESDVGGPVGPSVTGPRTPVAPTTENRHKVALGTTAPEKQFRRASRSLGVVMGAHFRRRVLL